MPVSKNRLVHVRYTAASKRSIVARHAYAVGQMVKVLPSAFGRRPKEVESSVSGNSFEITRLLPEVASSFQYRIKNMTTGQERVVTESEIRIAEADGASAH